MATSSNLRLRRDGLGLEAGDRGQHLEDRTGLVDGADDRIDEPGRIERGNRAVVVTVVRGIGRLRQDLAGIWIHDDGRHALCLVGGPRGEDLALERELEPRIDRQPDVLAGLPRIFDDDRVRDRPGGDVPLGVDDPRPSAEVVLVVLLDAVLTDPVPIHEAEQVGGERRVGPGTLVGVDAHGLGLEEHRLDLLGRGCRPDAIAGLLVETVGEDDVLLVGRHPGLEELRLFIVQPEQRDELLRHLPAPDGGQLRRHRGESLAVHGRRENYDPAAVVDVAAAAW